MGGHYNLNTLKITFADTAKGAKVAHIRSQCTATFRSDIYSLALAFDMTTLEFRGPPMSVGSCVTSCVLCSHMIGKFALIAIIQSCSLSWEELKLVMPAPILEVQAMAVTQV